MKHITKSIICLIIILTSLFMTSCYYYNPSGDIIEKGFDDPNSARGGIAGAVKSKINVFDVDDVTMDFYVGGGLLDDSLSQSVVLYFVKWDVSHKNPTLEEYRTTEGWYFMEEIDSETFNNGPFDVSIRFGYKSSNYYFRFLRKFTIPKNLFEEESGQILFVVATLPQFNQETGVYEFDTILSIHELRINYKKMDNGKILIE